MKNFLLYITLLLTLSVSSQNLVKNPSFEENRNCPVRIPIFGFYVNHWDNYFGSPDYYSTTCGSPGDAASTNNITAFDGNSFARISAYGDTGTAFVREYLHGEFRAPLEAGKFYRVTFYVRPVNTDNQGISFGIDNIGAFISDSIIDSIPTNSLYNYIQPQVQSTEILNNVNNWVSVCGVYKAKGGEQYITIGNFSPDNETSTIPLTGATNPQSAFYLVDFVQVIANDVPELPADTIICDEQRIDLEIPGGDVSVRWFQENDNPDPEATGPRYTITQAGQYWAEISTPGCTYTDSLLVELKNCDECKVFIPNAFSPNSDVEDNRTFKMAFSAEPSQCRLLNYRFKIFNRWGEKVFETDDIRVSWDGKSDDGKVVQGVYSYTLEYEYNLLRQTNTIKERGLFTLIL